MDLPTQCLKLVQVADPVMIPGDQSENKTFSTGLSTESVIDDLATYEPDASGSHTQGRVTA